MNESTPGQDCPPGEHDPDAKNYDIVRVRRVDGKDVVVHIDAQPRQPCGEPPKLVVKCRANASTTPYEQKITVEPSAAVGCVVEDSRASARSST